MKYLFMSVLLVITLLSLATCAQPVSGEVIKSDKERVSSPDVSQTHLTTLIAGNSNFAFDLYQALAMTYAGARGETEKQMSDTLRFTLSQDRLHPTFNGLDIELSKRGIHVIILELFFFEGEGT